MVKKTNKTQSKIEGKTCRVIDRNTNKQHQQLKSFTPIYTVNLWVIIMAWSICKCVCVHICVVLRTQVSVCMCFPLLSPKGSRQNDRKEDKLQWPPSTLLPPCLFNLPVRPMGCVLVMLCTPQWENSNKFELQVECRLMKDSHSQIWILSRDNLSKYKR